CHLASAILLSQQGSFTPSVTAEVKKKLPDPAVSRSTAVVNDIPTPKPSTPTLPRASAPIQVPATASTPVIEKSTGAGTNTSVKKVWGKISASVNVPNLNTIFEDKVEAETDEPDLVQGDTFREVTFNTFMMHWNAFADRLKQTNRITL